MSSKIRTLRLALSNSIKTPIYIGNFYRLPLRMLQVFLAIVENFNSQFFLVGAKWFCCAFKLGFLQLLCKASLIFKSNLELALSTILKQIWLYESKYVTVEYRWDLFIYYYLLFKNIRLAILFDMLLNPSFKMATSFTNVARTTASTSKFIY